jgi:uncharacterized protein
MIDPIDHDVRFAAADAEYDKGDYAGAFALFLSLAEAGDVSAMTRVAVMYGAGEGVPQDHSQSMFWDARAFDLGSVIAAFNLGVTHRNVGNLPDAVQWFERALQAGDGEAGLELAQMHVGDAATARRYLHRALASQLCDESREQIEGMLRAP